MSAEPVRRRKNRKANTSLGIPHTFSFPLQPTHECRAVNLHMMTLKILFHMDVKWRSRRSGFGRISHLRVRCLSGLRLPDDRRTLASDCKANCLRPPHDLSILHHEIDLPHCFDVIQRIYRCGDNVSSKTRHNCSALLVDPQQLRGVSGHAFKDFRCWHACGPPDCQIVPGHICTGFVWQINYNVGSESHLHTNPIGSAQPFDNGVAECLCLLGRVLASRDEMFRGEICPYKHGTFLLHQVQYLIRKNPCSIESAPPRMTFFAGSLSTTCTATASPALCATSTAVRISSRV